MECNLIEDLLHSVIQELDLPTRVRFALTAKSASDLAWLGLTEATFTEENVASVTKLFLAKTPPKLEKVVLHETFFPERLGVPPFLAQIRSFEWKMKMPSSAYTDYGKRRGTLEAAFSERDERILTFEAFVKKCWEAFDSTVLQIFKLDNWERKYDKPHIASDSFFVQPVTNTTPLSLREVETRGVYDRYNVSLLASRNFYMWKRCKFLQHVFIECGGFRRDAKTDRLVPYTFMGQWKDGMFYRMQI